MHAEITLNDALGATIYHTVVNKNLAKILEIGSWSGEGSTRCFVEALKQLSAPDKRIDCVEVFPDKFAHLAAIYADLDFVHCHNKSSVSYDELIYKNFDDIWDSKFNMIPKHIHSKETVKSWYDVDVQVMKKAESMNLGALGNYDGIFLDGSEFTGYSEFVLIKDKARVIFLDDVHQAFKCYEAHCALLADPEWSCLVDAPMLRNGFSVFEKIIK
jgi:hypothetical protein